MVSWPAEKKEELSSTAGQLGERHPPKLMFLHSPGMAHIKYANDQVWKGWSIMLKVTCQPAKN